MSTKKSKRGILPKLAMKGICKNAVTYLPYMAACIFVAFTFFTFDSILNNRIMESMPRAGYLKVLMMLGLVLLGIILIPFLFYTNSFLIKRRTKELGLYSILGMEKKHIAVMLLLENSILYIVVTVAGILLGVIFSKLMFLCLLNLIELAPNTAFTFSKRAFLDTIIFMGAIFLMNLFANLIQVGRSNPVELLKSSKKGEKETKHLWLFAISGFAVLIWGYQIAITSVMDSNIFTNFFLAIFLVILGTYFLFTSGSITLLKILKKRKPYYYKASNFITVSGMLYRMKKNAVSLVNICIFATMVIITLLCTSSLFMGMDGILNFMYPYDYEAAFQDAAVTEKADLQKEVEEIAEINNVTLTDYVAYSYMNLTLIQEGNEFLQSPEAFLDNNYRVNLMTEEEYNQIEGRNESLAKDEIIIFSTGNSFAQEKVLLGGKEYRIKREIQESVLDAKEERNTFQKQFYIIVSDEEVLRECSSYYGVDSIGTKLYKVQINIDGNEENRKEFIQNAASYQSGKQGFLSMSNNLDNREDIRTMNGGLLFLGIFFSIIFTICFILIMYYKQITEGFEDKESFEIMQKVGMNDKEVKLTIKKQILLVFFLPLAGALFHTLAGLNMIIHLLETINLFYTGAILLSMLFVVIIFTIFYFASYTFTAKTYYKIVKEMA